MTLELDQHIRYELAKLGLWQAMCKRNPQMALFDELDRLPLSVPDGASLRAGQSVEHVVLNAGGEPNHGTPSECTESAPPWSASVSHRPDAVAASINARGTDANTTEGLRVRPQKGA